LAQDQLHNLESIGAQGKAQPNLAGSPTDGIRDEAVDADAADQDRQSAKGASSRVSDRGAAVEEAMTLSSVRTLVTRTSLAAVETNNTTGCAS